MTKARSPPARSACFPHPVQRKERGWSVAAQEAPVEIYNDETLAIASWKLIYTMPRARSCTAATLVPRLLCFRQCALPPVFWRWWWCLV